jgi:uncharacterized membrane protein
MGSTKLRSLIKGITWEIISLIITFAAVYIIYGNLIKSIEFSICLNLIKLLFFYSHERIWKKYKWGKTK